LHRAIIAVTRSNVQTRDASRDDFAGARPACAPRLQDAPARATIPQRKHARTALADTTAQLRAGCAQAVENVCTRCSFTAQRQLHPLPGVARRVRDLRDDQQQRETDATRTTVRRKRCAQQVRVEARSLECDPGALALRARRNANAPRPQSKCCRQNVPMSSTCAWRTTASGAKTMRRPRRCQRSQRSRSSPAGRGYRASKPPITSSSRRGKATLLEARNVAARPSALWCA